MFDLMTEAVSNDVTQYQQLYSSVLIGEQSTTKTCEKVNGKSHAREIWHACNQCEKRFLSKGALWYHTNIHSGKFKCIECGKYLGSNRDLTAHMRSHSGEKPFECAVCPKRFSTSRELVVHGRTHSGEKPFKCHLCDKAFSQSDSRNKHVKLHTGEKPFMCYVCEKTFSSSGHLNEHVRIHTRQMPYKCSLCDKGFNLLSTFQGHKRRVHGITNDVERDLHEENLRKYFLQ